MSEHDAEQRAIRQLRAELANARACEDAYVEVMTEHLDSVLRQLDEARRIARQAATALTRACYELDGEDDIEVLLIAWANHAADEPLPDWLTAPDATECVDDLPGMWDESDLTGGETDATDSPRVAQETTAAGIGDET